MDADDRGNPSRQGSAPPPPPPPYPPPPLTAESSGTFASHNPRIQPSLASMQANLSSSPFGAMPSTASPSGLAVQGLTTSVPIPTSSVPGVPSIMDAEQAARSQHSSAAMQANFGSSPFGAAPPSSISSGLAVQGLATPLPTPAAPLPGALESTGTYSAVPHPPSQSSHPQPSSAPFPPSDTSNRRQPTLYQLATESSSRPPSFPSIGNTSSKSVEYSTQAWQTASSTTETLTSLAR
jgi:hypothetical protein